MVVRGRFRFAIDGVLPALALALALLISACVNTDPGGEIRGAGGEGGGAGTGGVGAAAGSGGAAATVPDSGAGGGDGCCGAGGMGVPDGGAGDAIAAIDAATGGPGGDGDRYPPPPRDLKLNLTGRSDAQIDFSPTAADPAARGFHGNSYAVFRNKAAVAQKKLVIGLHGIHNGAGPGGALGWAAGRGFHVIGVDYSDDDAGENGTGYLETWSGEDRSPTVKVGPADGVMNRIKTGLAYLATKDPGADWGYYLNSDGSVRWNDVIAFGYSFGGQTVVAATKYVPLARAIAVSAPSLDVAKDTWMTGMPALTPVGRCFMISGNTDGGNAQHFTAAAALGWPGVKVNANTAPPPYDDTHVLEVNFGHSEFCSIAQFDAACDYVFGTVKM